MSRSFNFSTSGTELSQIFRAWLAISFAFAVLLNRGLSFDSRFFILMGVAAGTVGIGFLLHELAHKIVALRFGCRAEFRSFDTMLILAVLMSFFGFILAAPGAVFIEGRVNQVKNGIISAVGPLTNMFLAAIFFLVAITARQGLVYDIGIYGTMINSWLSMFNLMPFLNLDGTKVLAWNKVVYFIMLFFAIILLVLPYVTRLIQ